MAPHPPVQAQTPGGAGHGLDTALGRRERRLARVDEVLKKISSKDFRLLLALAPTGAKDLLVSDFKKIYFRLQGDLLVSEVRWHWHPKMTFRWRSIETTEL